MNDTTRRSNLKAGRGRTAFSYRNCAQLRLRADLDIRRRIVAKRLFVAVHHTRRTHPITGKRNGIDGTPPNFNVAYLKADKVKTRSAILVSKGSADLKEKRSLAHNSGAHDDAGAIWQGSRCKRRLRNDLHLVQRKLTELRT